MTMEQVDIRTTTPTSFWLSVPEDCKKAIQELKRLKVAGLCAWDYEEVFTDVWWLVLHEVDLYAEGEFCREASRSIFGIGEPNAMNLKQAQTADRWLLRWQDLAYKYSLPEMLSDYHKQIHGGWGASGMGYYDGQLV